MQDNNSAFCFLQIIMILFFNRSQSSVPLNDTVLEKPPTNRQDKAPKAKVCRDDAAAPVKPPKDQPPTGSNIFLAFNSNGFLFVCFLFLKSLMMLGVNALMQYSEIRMLELTECFELINLSLRLFK